MPGTPATTSIHGAPRYANTDTADFAAQVNAVTDRFDVTAARIDTGLAAARPPAGIAGRWYFATDTLLLTRDTGAAWQDPQPNAHASRHQDGGADPLTVREAMMATGALGLAKGAFSAYRNAALSLTTGGLVAFDSEEFDVSNWFDATTGRFTPLVAGYYHLNWCVRSANVLTADNYWITTLRKSAANYKNGQISYQRSATSLSSVGTAIAQANGTTDVFDIIIQHNVGATSPVLPGALETYFQGRFIGRS